MIREYQTPIQGYIYQYFYTATKTKSTRWSVQATRESYITPKASKA